MLIKSKLSMGLDIFTNGLNVETGFHFWMLHVGFSKMHQIQTVMTKYKDFLYQHVHFTLYIIFFPQAICVYKSLVHPLQVEQLQLSWEACPKVVGVYL